MLKYVIFVSIYIFLVNCMFDHGSFDMKVTHHVTCKGPKRRNCSRSSVTLENNAVLKFDSRVLEDTKIVKGKITGHLDNKELLKIQIKSVCDHIFFRPLFMVFLNETDQCGFFKGHYKFTVDVPAVSQSFYGDNFIYGNWTYHASFFSDFCNMHCEYVYITILPKKQ